MQGSWDFPPLYSILLTCRCHLSLMVLPSGIMGVLRPAGRVTASSDCFKRRPVVSGGARRPGFGGLPLFSSVPFAWLTWIAPCHGLLICKMEVISSTSLTGVI